MSEKQTNKKQQVKFQAIRAKYEEEASNRTFNALVAGPPGSGKTMLLRTCPMPLILHSFDPGGSKVLLPEIAEGNVLVTRFEQEKSTAPSVWAAWGKEYDELKRIGAFERIGTYCIDSLGPWINGLMNGIAHQRGRKDNLPAIQDYLWAGTRFQDIIRELCALPCHFVMTCHLATDKCDVTGEVRTHVKVFKSLQIDVPAAFDEVYIMDVKTVGDQTEYRVLTRNLNRLRAKTRIGRDKFDRFEPADVKALLKKAGLPSEDKPPLFEQEGGEDNV